MADIIEVTPPVFRGGWYTPHGRQKVRTAPSTKFPSVWVGLTEAGNGFEVDKMLHDETTEWNTWLRIASNKRWVALIYGKDILGEGEWQYA